MVKIRDILEYCKREKIDNREFFSTHKCFLDTFSGLYLVKYIDLDCWVHTDGNGGFGQSWCCHYDVDIIVSSPEDLREVQK